jgi:carboxyl-terminal processing protease
MEKVMIKKRLLNVALICAIIVSVMVLFGPVRFGDQSNAETDDVYENMKLFTVILNEIEKKYVEKEDPQKLIYGAIKGMVETLDPHSAFLTPEEYKELKIETRGAFSGIGIEITIRDGVLTVVSPIEGTPAFKAGLKAGDKIIKINGKVTKNMTLMDAVKNIRGPRGTDVTLTILREGAEKLIDVVITRGVVTIKSVKSNVIDDTIGYARISTFQEQTSDLLKEALKGMMKGKKPLEGFILDLRNDPGGLLDQAVEVCDLFLDSGLIVYTKGRIESQNMSFDANPEVEIPNDVPMIVLVNQGSASASEIVAGALQDHKRALILGMPTFGKGSVQTIIPLTDNSGLRLTTALYYTPNGTSIQAKGITPDILVESKQPLTKEQQERQKKLKYLREKDLIHHLQQQSGEDQEDQQGNDQQGVIEQKDESTKKEKTILKEEEKEQAELSKDNQLQRAVQILKSWTIFSKMENKTP